ncbi:hypothetical protein [Halomonas sp. SpR8]|uniref:hypothetical protein n=1 Tax=Halomonas sp. SpR8 TaxID=3050463 RepID=UPI0027E5B3BE|nr:hypothetical protein [Halomonas sp. SpR8]MDQ7730142.1 hypothetical protein [Halomonas sp. SpR8]
MIRKAVLPVAGFGNRCLPASSHTGDCRQPLGYLEAIVAYARRHPGVGQAFQTFLSRYH